MKKGTKLFEHTDNYYHTKGIVNPNAKVNIKELGIGYLIEITDSFTTNALSVTKEELKKIVMYGQLILHEEDAKNRNI